MPTVEGGTRPQATFEGSAEPTRAVRRRDFELPRDPATALLPFTLEGDREWVSGWEPEYLSGATDEVGAVWRTSHEQDLTWITTDREDARVR
jgi:hypothetical protein